MDFKQIQEHATELESIGRTRNDMYTDIDEMYLCIDDTLPQRDWIKETISPEARNMVDGAARLLRAGDPIWSVPIETNERAIAKKASMLEKAARAIWTNAGQVSGRPRHYDPVLSALLYAEIQIPVISTKLLAKTAKGKQKDRWERIAEKAPILFDCVPPREGYSQWGLGGLDAYYSKRSMLVGEVWSRYGETFLSDRKYSERIDVSDYWSLDDHCIWAAGESKPIIKEANPYPYIPIVSTMVEGSMLFQGNSEYQTRQPFLYAVWKTNVWKRANLHLTLVASLAFEVGSTPLLVFESISETEPVINFDEPGGLVKIKAGEKIYPLMVKAVSADLTQAGQQWSDLLVQSTMYRQVFGESLGPNAPFSYYSSVAQAGRLPMVVYQKMLSFSFGQAMQMAFDMIREEKGQVRVSGEKGQGAQNIKANDIPKEFDLQASLEITLPQDERLNAQVATQLVGAGLISKQYAREVFLRIGQSDEMEEQIQEERYQDMYAQMDLQREAQRLQMQMQPGMQQGMQQPGQPGVPPGGPQVPPEMAQPGMQPGMPGVEEGLPMMEPAEPTGSPFGGGGLPPQMEGE